MVIDPRVLRNALGQFATGVTVITAAPPDAAPMGMTVNSFAGVSLEPPLVLWCLQKDSDCFEAFDAVRHYGVNILQASQQTVSNRYATKGQHDLEAGSYRQGKTGCPVLKDVMVNLECRVVARHDAGDHVVLVGEVEAMEARYDRKPLVFFGGRYRELK